MALYRNSVKDPGSSKRRSEPTKKLFNYYFLSFYLPANLHSWVDCRWSFLESCLYKESKQGPCFCISTCSSGPGVRATVHGRKQPQCRLKSTQNKVLQFSVSKIEKQVEQLIGLTKTKLAIIIITNLQENMYYLLAEKSREGSWVDRSSLFEQYCTNVLRRLMRFLICLKNNRASHPVDIYFNDRHSSRSIKVDRW